MNKDNAKDYLPLVQALAEGKVLQYFPDGWEGWIDCDDVNFCIDASKFRIKPEPLVIYAAMRDTKDAIYIASRNVLAVQDSVASSNYTDGKVRKFVEVIED